MGIAIEAITREQRSCAGAMMHLRNHGIRLAWHAWS
jgi:hypothetical protein